MYYPVAFAESGDQSTIPNTGTELGTINFPYGYGSNYSASLESDPDALRVDRLHFNYLMYTMTANWQALYQTGTVPFITSMENLGSPFAYALNAIVQYSDGKIYFNTVAANTASPPGNGWQVWQPQVLKTVTASPGSTAVNTIVVANGGGLMTIPLPATAADGDTFQVSGVGAGGWIISQAAGQQIFFGNMATTLGATGTLASSNRYDDVTLKYYTALGNWKVVASIGNMTVV